MPPRHTALPLLLAAALLPPTATADSGTIWATPHDSYSSSIGVLGCHINTDRVAYWPSSVDCTNICVQVSYQDRSVYLLKVDQSQGAHDMSYDAWNYLITGKSATENPTSGGAVEMTYEDVDAEHCKDHIKVDGFPISASNSMNFLASCLEDQGSYVAQNYALYNILDSTCQWGYNEVCELVDYPNQNQPSCPHTLGLTTALTDTPVWNIIYPTGQKVKVGDTANYSYTPGTPNNADSGGSSNDEEDASAEVRPSVAMAMAAVGLGSVLVRLL